MIAQCRLLDDRWTGTWRTGRHAYAVGDYVIVNCAGAERLAIIDGIGRTRKAVCPRTPYKGALKTIRRKATHAEIKQALRIEIARDDVKAARRRVEDEKAALRALLRGSKW